MHGFCGTDLPTALSNDPTRAHTHTPPPPHPHTHPMSLFVCFWRFLSLSFFLTCAVYLCIALSNQVMTDGDGKCVPKIDVFVRIVLPPRPPALQTTSRRKCPPFKPSILHLFVSRVGVFADPSLLGKGRRRSQRYHQRCSQKPNSSHRQECGGKWQSA